MMTSAAGVLTWMVALTFALSAAAKFRYPSAATQAVRRFLNSERLPVRSGAVLGAVELTVGLLLATSNGLPVLRQPAAVAASALLWAFSVGLLANVVLGRRFPCDCFGPTQHDISYATVLRTMVLAVTATYLATTADRVARDARSLTLEAAAAVAVFAVIVLGDAALQATQVWSGKKAIQEGVR